MPPETERAGILPILRKVADGLAGLSAALAALALLFEVGVILVDVTGRALAHPLYGSQDLVISAMIVVVFGAMAETDRRGRHIAVDLLQSRFPRALNRAIDILVALLGAVIFLALAWTTWESALLSMMFNLSTNLLNLPKAWFQFALCGFCVVTAFGMTVKAVELSLGRHRPVGDGAAG